MQPNGRWTHVVGVAGLVVLAACAGSQRAEDATHGSDRHAFALRVVTTEGAPVFGAHVRWHVSADPTRRSERFAEPIGYGVTDESGIVTFTPKEPGSHTATVRIGSDPGLLLASTRFEVGRGFDSAELVVPPLADVTWQATLGGAPVPGGWLLVSAAGRAGQGTWVPLDVDGIASMSLPLGDWVANVLCSDPRIDVSVPAHVAGGAARFDLEVEAGVLYARFVDDTGAPLDGFGVALGARGVGHAAMTDTDGYACFGNLAPGVPWHPAVRGDTHVADFETLVVAPGEWRDAGTLTVRRTATIRLLFSPGPERPPAVTIEVAGRIATLHRTSPPSVFRVDAEGEHEVVLRASDGATRTDRVRLERGRTVELTTP